MPEKRLRSLQAEGDLIFAVDAYLIEVSVPGFARVEPQLLSRLAGQHVPGAFDILRRKGLAVVPFDAPAQREGQFGAVLAP